MELTKFSDYSLRMLLYLGLHEKRNVSLLEISEAYSISRNHLVKIAKHLSDLEVIMTVRGKGGGIQLAQPHDKINIGEIVRSTEGHIPLVECFNPDTNKCCIISSCTLKGILKKAEQAFYKELDKYSLEDLLRGKLKLKGILQKN